MDRSLIDRLYVALPEGRARAISPTVITKRLVLPEITPQQHMRWIEDVLEANPLITPGVVAGTAIEPPSAFRDLLGDACAAENLSEGHTILGPRLMACEGCNFHHDADYPEYSNAAFSVLWLENETPWDLVFPLTGQRIEMEAGMLVIFDAANIHGVVSRGASKYRDEDFGEPGFQMFFSTDHQYTAPSTRDRMGIQYLTAAECATRQALQPLANCSSTFDITTGHISL